MIKQIFALVLLVGVLGLLIISADIGETKILVVSGNNEQKPLNLELNKTLCSESKILISDLYNTAQAVLPNGDTHFFNDIGNAFIWLMRQKDREHIKLFVYTNDSKRFIDAKVAWYARNEITPMGYGFGAYEYHAYGTCDYYYDEVLLCAARGETVINPLIYWLLKKGKI